MKILANQFATLNKLKLENQKKVFENNDPIKADRTINITNSLEILGNYNKAIAFRGTTPTEEEAIFELFGFDEEAKNKYRELVSEQTTKWTKNTPMHFAVFTFFGFNDEQIKRYNSKVTFASGGAQEKIEIFYGNANEKYELNQIELAYLISNGLNDSQLSEYAKLKKEGVKLSGVGAEEKRFELTSEEIVQALKEGKVGIDIENEKRLYSLLKKGVQLEHAVKISKYPEMFARIEKPEDAVDVVEYIDFGLTTEAMIQNYNSHCALNKSHEQALILAQNDITVSELPRLNSLISTGIDYADAVKLANNDGLYNRYEELLNIEIFKSLDEVSKLVETGVDNDEQLKRIEEISERYKSSDGNSLHARSLAILSKVPKEYFPLIFDEANKCQYDHVTLDNLLSNLDFTNKEEVEEQLKRIKEINEKYKDNNNVNLSGKSLGILSKIPEEYFPLLFDESNKCRYGYLVLDDLLSNFDFTNKEEVEKQLKRIEEINEKYKDNSNFKLLGKSLAVLSKMPEEYFPLFFDESNKCRYDDELHIILPALDFKNKEEAKRQLEKFKDLKNNYKDNNGDRLSVYVIATLLKVPEEYFSLFFDESKKCYYGEAKTYDIVDRLNFDDEKSLKEQSERFKKYIKMGVKPEKAIKIATNEKYYKLLGEKRTLNSKEAAFLALNTSATSRDLSNLSPEVLAKFCTGEMKEIAEIMDSAKAEVRNSAKAEVRNSAKAEVRNSTTFNVPQESDLGLNELSVPYRNGRDVSYNRSYFDYNNGKLKFNQIGDSAGISVRSSGNIPFEVEIKSSIVNGAKVLIVKNMAQPNETYVYYKGAVGLVKDEMTSEQKAQLVESLKDWAKLSEEQTKNYATACEDMPFKMYDNEYKTIIGAGVKNGSLNIPAFEIKGKNAIQTKNKFEEKLTILKNAGELTVENLIRIMPKGVDLQISPYITYKKTDNDNNNGTQIGTAISQAISTEWKTSTGEKVELRTHSADLRINPNGKPEWIYRFGIEDKTDGKIAYYYFDGNTFRADKNKQSSRTHVEINQTPFDDSDYLISKNFDFQRIMRQISINYSGKYEKIAQSLDADFRTRYPDDRSLLSARDSEIKEVIIGKCLNNPQNYFNYRGTVEDILEDCGLPSIRRLKLLRNSS